MFLSTIFWSALSDPRADSGQQPLRVFDAGTGTALIPIELMRRGLQAVIKASDLADQMLVIARQNVVDGRVGRIKVIEPVLRDCKRLPDADDTYDAVMSNSIVHHIPEPHRVIAELWRVLKSSGLFFIRDLMRPDDVADSEHHANLRRRRERAPAADVSRFPAGRALAVKEIRKILVEIGILGDGVQATSDRHWTISRDQELTCASPRILCHRESQSNFGAVRREATALSVLRNRECLSSHLPNANATLVARGAANQWQTAHRKMF